MEHLWNTFTAFLEDNTAWAGAMAGFSILLLLGSIAVTPWILARLPHDYFHNPNHQTLESFTHRPVLRGVLIVLKNALGLLLFAAGLSMLVLPGQGLLTLLVAFLLLDVPGKFALKRKIVSSRRIHATINRFRENHGKPPFTDDF